MSPTPLRNRVISATAATAIAATGLIGAAATAGTASAAECNQTAVRSEHLVVKYGFEKSVPATVGAGTSVTYRLAVSTDGIGNPYVQGIWDSPPVALRDVKPTVKVSRFTLLGGILGSGGLLGDIANGTTVDPGEVVREGNSWKISSTGWAVFAGKATVAEYTYKLPDSVKKGTQLISGGWAVDATPNPPLGHVAMGDKTVCTTVRAANVGESIGGSLEGAGLGSSDLFGSS